MAACASTEAPASLAQTPQEGARAEVEPKQPDPSPALGPVTYLVGVVGQSGVEHCPPGGAEREWRDLHPTIGHVQVSGPEGSIFDPVMDQPVVAVGQPVDAPPGRPSTALAPEEEPCTPAQMRSDWRRTPRGTRIERGDRPDFRYFHADTVRPLHELQARVDGEHVVVGLTNPVPVALADVELRLHYEGCFGKPGSTSKTKVIGELGEGAHVEVRLPMWIRSDAAAGRNAFRAYSVQLLGKGEGVVLDLDVSLLALGAQVQCQER